MIPPHEITDPDKVKALVASIEANGWQGPPLVRDGEYLITGTHRYAAAQELGMMDHEIPTIELAQLFEDAGLDIDELHAEYDHPTIDDPLFDHFLGELPQDILDKYGIERR